MDISRGREEVGEGGGFGWGGVGGWGEKAYNCNRITIKSKKKRKNGLQQVKNVYYNQSKLQIQII